MLKEVSGDILLTSAQAIAHGVAPNDHFASGLALALREQWPAMVRDFRHWCRQESPKEGGAWVWSGADGRRIVSLLTQERAPSDGATPGRATLEYVSHALRELERLISSERIDSIALPRLATGVGGLSWEEVRPLIDRHLGGLNIPVYVYSTYQKGVRASEG